MAEPKVQNVQIDPSAPLGPQLAKVPENVLKMMVEQANNWIQMTQAQGMVNEVAQEMKEIPVLPSEKPQDTNAITHVDMPQEGGVLTWMQNMEYPYRGFPHFEFVDKIDAVKKIGRSLLSGLYHELKTKNILLITLLPALWIVPSVVRAGIFGCYRVVERFRLKKDKYSLFIRELYRVLSLDRPEEKVKDAEFRQMFRDTVCMILEMDNAYRFRAQDILAELNKDELKKNPTKELVRLLSLMQDRELDQKLKDTWKLMKYFIRIGFDKKFQQIIVNAFLQLDMEKVKLTIEDKAYCVPRKDYHFGFQLHPTDEDLTFLRKHSLFEEYKQERKKIMQESSVTHQEVVKKYTPLTEQNKPLFNQEMAQLDKKYNDLLKNSEEQYALKKGALT